MSPSTTRKIAFYFVQPGMIQIAVGIFMVGRALDVSNYREP